MAWMLRVQIINKAMEVQRVCWIMPIHVKSYYLQEPQSPVADPEVRFDAIWA